MSQSKFFSAFLKNSTQDLLTGKSLSVLVFGTTGSGKSYTIRGGEGKKRGLALRSAELLLTIIEKQRSCVQIKVSVAAIFNDKAVDLLPAQESAVHKTSDFHAALNQALKSRKNISEKQNKDKIHMVIVLRLYQDFELLSEAYFVELAGSEYAREDKQVARSFNSISSQLTQNPATNTWQTNPLCAYLHKALDIYGANPCSVLLICCASQGIDNFKDTLASLKFTSRIKECIGEGAVRPEIGQIDGFLHQLERVGVVEALGILESIEVGVKKLVAGDRVCERRDRIDKYKQVRVETLQDIEGAKSKIDKKTTSVEEYGIKTLALELEQARANYSMLQEQFNSLLEEKSQSSIKQSEIHVKIADELLECIKQLSDKLKEEQKHREKIATEARLIRNILLRKGMDQESMECNCSEEVRNLQNAIQEVNDDRKKTLERLEASLKENRIKEEHIQALHSTSSSYEQEAQNLSKIISDYETIDLRTPQVAKWSFF